MKYKKAVVTPASSSIIRHAASAARRDINCLASLRLGLIAVTLIGAFILSLFAVAPKALAAGNNEICNDIKDVIKIIDCGNEQVVSFIGFKGGLQAPTDKGLDATLTRAKTAREFIVNTVNFALTFLGIIALVIVIYGGFLYITAGGAEEQSTKGKKSITYAVIGILIIMASFALVNTLLTFGGGTATDRSGTGPGGNRGVGQEGSNIGQQIVYNLGAAEINAGLNDFVSAYKNLSAIAGLYQKIKSLPPPTDRGENRSYLSEISNIVTEIRNNTNALSKTRQVAQSMLDEYLSGVLALSSEQLTDEKYGIDGPIQEAKPVGPPTVEGVETNSDVQREVLKKITAGGDFDILAASKADFKDSIDLLIGPGPARTELPEDKDVKGRLPLVWKIMGDVAKVNSVGDVIQRGLISEQDLQRAFSGIDPNTKVGELFAEAIAKIDDARHLADDPKDTSKIIEAVRALDRLYIIVKDIKFTYVKIRATVREGNAPLVVELNGLDSRDPTGQSIPEESYNWDPDGDGKEGPPAGGGSFARVSCGDSKGQGSTLTCTYNQPGTYIVRLSINSKDPSHIAAGQAFLPITVHPSVARIGLKATIGAVNEELRKYEKDPRGAWNLTIDKNELHVTTQEANTTGVSFDASSSEGGNGQTLKLFSWSFGDGSLVDEGPTKSKIDNHLYKKEGKYALKLEVTDAGNRQDRKIMNVVIAALAARIGTKQTIGEPDALFEFDGSLSRSDHGQINSYKWTVLDKDGNDITNFQNAVNIIGDPNAPVFRVKFKRPGTYSVRLQISDGSGTDLAQTPISIKSRKPRANFTVASCPDHCPDPSQPSLADLDGSMSFDPDEGDVLTYNWEFYNELGDKLEEKTGFTLDPPGAKISGKQAKHVRIKFLALGKFKAILRVNDSHADPNILQEDTKEKTLEIKSLVEAKWDPSLNPVARLDEKGEASFVFSGTTKNANQAHIDYGDGTSDDAVADPKEISKDGVWSFKLPSLTGHTYTKAGAYLVSIKLTSEDSKGENSLAKRIYIASGNSPVAVMEVSVDDIPVTLPSPTRDDPTPSLEIIRNKVITFDAHRSIDSTGKVGPANLTFSWDFGDKKPSTGAVAKHAYTDISPQTGPYLVKLTVSEKNTFQSAEETFSVNVVSKKPQINTLSLEKKTLGDTTPVEVKLTAESANGKADPDGKVTNYQFWYYDPANKDQKLSVIDTLSNTATLTVETNGEENEEHEYYFCVSATDNENFASECSELFQENELPKVKVKNGPNKAPIVAFSVDRTSVRPGEPVTFTSSSTDPDGKIVQYVWDLEGDGFQNDNPTELPTITHTYDHKSPQNGYRVKLKAIDDKGAAGYSKETVINVEPISKSPTVNFSFSVDPVVIKRVKFFGDAKVDPDVTDHPLSIKKWTWDFDTSQEFGCDKDPKPKSCNGDKADDEDSTEQNPIFDYPASGTYQVKLTVEDTDENSSEKTGLVSLIAGRSGGTGTSTPLSNILRAELKTDPPLQFETIAGQKRKVLHVPAKSDGQTVSLVWGDSKGKIGKYIIDKNIWCNSDGKPGANNRADDVDNPQPPETQSCTLVSTGQKADNCWTTNYQRYATTGHPAGPGHFTTRLTVVDDKNAVDTNDVEIIFDGATDVNSMLKFNCSGKSGNLGGASLFKQLGTQNTILLSILSGVIVVLIGYGASSFLRRGRRRDI